MSITLVLWDIDHTLIVSGPAGPGVYARAFYAVTGRPPDSAVPTEGRTEPEIFQELLDRHGVDGIGHEQAVHAMVAALADSEAELRAEGRVLPGVARILAHLQRHPGLVQSVLTGNLRPNAALKLGCFDLDRFLDLDSGAYGSDHSTRSELVAFAQERAAARYGAPFERHNTVLVGDTVRDVRAGLGGGARVVAVATGHDSHEDLSAAGADHVLPDLCDVEAVTRAVLKQPHVPGTTTL